MVQKIFQLIMITLFLIVVAGCSSQTIVKYQCVDGSFVDSADSCSAVKCQTNCPELDCSNCPVKTETKTVEKTITKYQCYDGSLQSSLSNCKDPEEYLEEVKKSILNIDDFREDVIKIANQKYQLEEVNKVTINGNVAEVEIQYYNFDLEGIYQQSFYFVKAIAPSLLNKDNEVTLKLMLVANLGAGNMVSETPYSLIKEVNSLSTGYEDWKKEADIDVNSGDGVFSLI